MSEAGKLREGGMRYPAAMFFSVLLALPLFCEAKSAVRPAGSIGAGPVRAKSGGRLFAGEPAILTATVYDINGIAQQNRRIDFFVENAVKEKGPKLNKSTGITDKYGNVSVELSAGSDPSELNLIRARAAGVKNPASSEVLFRIRAWAKPLARLAGNFALVEDISAVKIDTGISGGRELPETRTLCLAKKPDMFKLAGISDSSKYLVFKGGKSCSVSGDGNTLNPGLPEDTGILLLHMNYACAPDAFLLAHSVKTKLSEKPGLSEVYSVEAAPNRGSKAYSRLVVGIDYLTGLDTEVEKYGTDKLPVSRTVIKKASEFDVLQKKWTGNVYERGKPYEPDPAYLESARQSPDKSRCWIPVETETASYSGNSSTVIRTRFEDIKVNTGISESEFTIP